MSQQLVSIVVPVYNTAQYLPRCIDSLLSQDYENIEIILVDDGSTDNSFEICKRYESEKVKVFTKQNEGPAMTRNYGMDKCSLQAKYLAFVDSDDTVENDYISKLLYPESDMSVCALNHLNEDDIDSSYNQNVNGGVYKDLSVNKSFCDLFENGIMNSPCNKLFSLQIIRDESLQFKNIRSLEDVDFVFQYLRFCKSVFVVNKPLYNYWHRTGSETSRVSKDIYENYMILHQEMLDWFDDSLSKQIDRFVYPQYFGVTLRFIRNGEYSIPSQYLKNALIKRAFKAHKCCSLGEIGIHILVKLRMLRMVKFLFL